MERRILATLLALVMGLCAVSAHAAETDEKTDALTLASQTLAELFTKDYQAVHDRYVDTQKELISVADVQEAWENTLVTIGPFRSIVDLVQVEQDDLDIVQAVLRHENGQQKVTLVYEQESGAMVALNLQQESKYIIAEPLPLPQGTTEEEIRLRPGEVDETGGLLTVPAGEGPFPAVVMIHASGASDRDEAVFGVRPFRDIAMRLADQGVASIRYDKYSFAHPEQIGESTMETEYGKDVRAAVALLSADDRIGEIYLLGHSEGGRLVPRMMMENREHVSGGIILAGSPRPLWEILRLQNEAVLESMEGASYVENRKLIDAEVEKAMRLQEMTEEELDTLTVFGVNARYQLDVSSPDPIEAAKELALPLLILQGREDFQVSADVDFAAWKEGLADEPYVTFKLYPDLTHLFIAVEGVPEYTPKDYSYGGHVSEKVTNDIAAWIKEQE